MSPPEFHPVPVHRVRFSTRFLIYFGVWFLSALAFQMLLQPEALTETHLSPMQQRIRWLLFAPLMAVVGLAQAVTWPAYPDSSAVLTAGAVFVVHAIIALTGSRRGSVATLACFETVLLAVAVIYYVRQSLLPIGG